MRVVTFVMQKEQMVELNQAELDMFLSGRACTVTYDAHSIIAY